MTISDDPPDDLLRRAAAGDADALASLFVRFRDRLKHMVQLRGGRARSGRASAPTGKSGPTP
jgi:hypothetical protein